MDSPNPVILKVSIPAYKKVMIETSDGMRYFCDLKSFESVYCFPKDELQWSKVSPDSYGLGLVWESRFEVHVSQIVALAERKEKIQKSA